MRIAKFNAVTLGLFVKHVVIPICDYRVYLPAPLPEVVSISKGTCFACRVCHDLSYESRQKSGSLFYELIERPMKIHDKALAALKRSRASRRQEWNFQRMEWADRVLKYGFLRLPGAAEILGPMFAKDRTLGFMDRREGLCQTTESAQMRHFGLLSVR